MIQRKSGDSAKSDLVVGAEQVAGAAHANDALDVSALIGTTEGGGSVTPLEAGTACDTSDSSGPALQLQATRDAPAVQRTGEGEGATPAPAGPAPDWQEMDAETIEDLQSATNEAVIIAKYLPERVNILYEKVNHVIGFASAHEEGKRGVDKAQQAANRGAPAFLKILQFIADLGTVVGAVGAVTKSVGSLLGAAGEVTVAAKQATSAVQKAGEAAKEGAAVVEGVEKTLGLPGKVKNAVDKLTPAATRVETVDQALGAHIANVARAQQAVNHTEIRESTVDLREKLDVFKEKARHFNQVMKNATDRHSYVAPLRLPMLSLNWAMATTEVTQAEAKLGQTRMLAEGYLASLKDEEGGVLKEGTGGRGLFDMISRWQQESPQKVKSIWVFDLRKLRRINFTGAQELITQQQYNIETTTMAYPYNWADDEAMCFVATSDESVRSELQTFLVAMPDFGYGKAFLCQPGLASALRELGVFTIRRDAAVQFGVGDSIAGELTSNLFDQGLQNWEQSDKFRGFWQATLGGKWGHIYNRTLGKVHALPEAWGGLRQQRSRVLSGKYV